MKTKVSRSRLGGLAPVLFVATAASLMLVAGCGDKAEQASGTTGGSTTTTAPGTVAPPGTKGAPPAGFQAPGNPNANAASNAAAFRAAREKAEGK